MLTDIRHPEDPNLYWWIVSYRYPEDGKWVTVEDGYWVDADYRNRLMMFAD